MNITFFPFSNSFLAIAEAKIVFPPIRMIEDSENPSSIILDIIRCNTNSFILNFPNEIRPVNFTFSEYYLIKLKELI